LAACLPRDGALGQEEFVFMPVADIVQGGNLQLKEGAADDPSEMTRVQDASTPAEA
jgi:hypothetical protein